MSDPLQTDKNRLPAPAQGFRGLENSDPGGRFSFATIARLWRPRNTVNEQPACTVSRFAHRIVTADGRAYSADELLAGGGSVTAAIIAAAANAGTAQEKEDIRVALDLDDGEGNIPVDGVKLSNQPTAALPAGTLGRNGNRLALHDGSTLGGITSRRFAGLKILTESQQRPGGVNSDLYHELFRLRLSALEYAAGKIITVVGTSCLEASGADCAVYFGVSPEQSSGAYVQGVLQTLRNGIAFERRFWAKRYIITAGGVLEAPNGGTYVDGPSLSVTREGIEGADQFSTDPNGTNGIQQDLVFALHTSSTGVDLDPIFFSYDLEISVQ